MIPFKDESKIEKELSLEPEFISSVHACKKAAYQILNRISNLFDDYTDHSLEHSQRVLIILSELLQDNISKITKEECYVIIMACLLHDIGMSIPQNKINEFLKEDEINSYFDTNPDSNYKDFVRSIHHKLSYSYIRKEFRNLGIINEFYAEAIAIVARNHRKTNILYDLEKIKFIIPKDGIGIAICTSYLSCILRIADELDVTNFRTPYLIRKYFFPKNEESIKEFLKHISTLFVNFEDKVIEISAECSSSEIYYEILSNCNQIQKMLNDCQKIIRNLPIINGRKYYLQSMYISTEKIKAIGFIPKKIGFSMNTKNVFNKFMNEVLYQNPTIAIREIIQNSLDTCRFKKTQFPDFIPKIEIYFENNELIVEDNGMGMDFFIIENYFAKLGSSYYQQLKVKDKKEITAQFGVGIFSFFMICDEFTVITRRLDEDIIKFHVQKNVDSFFHFIPPSSDDYIENGTKIKLFLKNSLIEKINPDKIIEIIRSFLIFNEIPINVKIGKKSEVLKTTDYEITLQFIKKNWKYQKSEVLPENPIKILNEYNEQNEMKTSIGVFFNEEKILNTTFEEYSRRNNKIIFCYKGIFVEKIVEDISISPFYSYLGIINVLETKSLQLSRGFFMDRNFVDRIKYFFNAQSIKIFFNHFSTHEKIMDIIEYYFMRSYRKEFNFGINSTIIEIAKRYPIFRILNIDNKFSLITIEELFHLKNIIYLYGMGGDFKFARFLIKKLKKPILIPYLTKNLKNLTAQLIFKNFNTILIIDDNKCYFHIKCRLDYSNYLTVKNKKRYGDENIIFIPFDNEKHINYNIAKNDKLYFNHFIYNINCPIVKYLISKISNDYRARDLILNYFKIRFYNEQPEKFLDIIIIYVIQFKIFLSLLLSFYFLIIFTKLF